MEVALTYEDLCKQRCVWCQVGRGKAYVDHYRHLDDRGLLSEDGPPCTAPTAEGAYAELSREVAALREDKADLDWLEDNPDVLHVRGGGATWSWEYELGKVLLGSIRECVRAARAKETTNGVE